MKELLKSKSMIGLMLFILGAVYLNSVTIKNETRLSKEVSNNSELVYNK